jgi:hypothetical protein
VRLLLKYSAFLYSIILSFHTFGCGIDLHDAYTKTLKRLPPGARIDVETIQVSKERLFLIDKDGKHVAVLIYSIKNSELFVLSHEQFRSPELAPLTKLWLLKTVLLRYPHMQQVNVSLGPKYYYKANYDSFLDLVRTLILSTMDGDFQTQVRDPNTVIKLLRILDANQRALSSLRVRLKEKTFWVAAQRTHARAPGQGTGLNSILVGHALLEFPDTERVGGKLMEDNRLVYLLARHDGASPEQAVLTTPYARIMAKYGYTKIDELRSKLPTTYEQSVVLWLTR